MKAFFSALLIIASFSSKGQKIRGLKEVSSRDTIKAGQSIIYGLFVQRLGFSSGGFPQDIRLINLDSKEIFAFRVKPTFKSAKENSFYYYIPPGNYAILHYWWTESKWYGGKTYIEPILKGLAASSLQAKIRSGQMKEEELEQFKFSIQPNSLNYVGTWYFDKEIVSFRDEKSDFDKELTRNFSNLDFVNAFVTIPN